MPFNEKFIKRIVEVDNTRIATTCRPALGKFAEILGEPLMRAYNRVEAEFGQDEALQAFAEYLPLMTSMVILSWFEPKDNPHVIDNVMELMNTTLKRAAVDAIAREAGTNVISIKGGTDA